MKLDSIFRFIITLVGILFPRCKRKGGSCEPCCEPLPPEQKPEKKIHPPADIFVQDE